jgi:hypothetical protein
MPKNKIMLIRHAEKPNGELGELPNGSENEESLTPTGWKRAIALVGLFSPAAGVGFKSPHLAKPASLFASKPNAMSQSMRPEQTLAPLSKALPCPINLDWGLGDEDKLVSALIGATSPTLVAWHHQKIPLVAGRILGTSQGIPPKWKHKRFDLVWILDQDDDNNWQFCQVPQLLLPGDSDKPIRSDDPD